MNTSFNFEVITSIKPDYAATQTQRRFDDHFSLVTQQYALAEHLDKSPHTMLW